MKFRHRACSSFLAIVIYTFAPPLSATEWGIEPGSGQIGFIASYDEIEFDSRFGEFSGSIRFDPSSPGNGMFDVTVVIDSVDSDSPDRDQGMLEVDWFDADQYPIATFVSSSFGTSAPASFTVTGNLTIRGETHSTTFDFDWSRSADKARMHGRSVVDRRQFGIGSGDWAADDTIGFQVTIVFDLTLTQKP